MLAIDQVRRKYHEIGKKNPAASKMNVPQMQDKRT